MSLVFLLSHIPNPRMNKRIGVVKEITDTTLICWDKQSNQLFNLYHDDIKNIVIKMAASTTEPLKRIRQTMNFGIKAYKEILKIKPKCIYAGNFDMLLIAYIYSILHNSNLVYEVADLNRLIVDKQESLSKVLIQKIITFIEKIMCRRVSLLILTSNEYYNYYYKNIFPKQKLLVIPNVPDIAVFKDYKKKANGKFTVGFVGGIRYINQIKMMIDVAELIGIQVLIAGAGFSNEDDIILREYCRNKNFIDLIGNYDYSKQIGELYGKCDCIYSVYDADLKNVQLAIPNRLYEAIYCELPIIVAKQTYLAELVESMRVGVSVKHNETKDLLNELNRLSTDKEYYNGFVKNCIKQKNNININIYNEHLTTCLEKLVI